MFTLVHLMDATSGTCAVFDVLPDLPVEEGPTHGLHFSAVCFFVGTLPSLMGCVFIQKGACTSSKVEVISHTL